MNRQLRFEVSLTKLIEGVKYNNPLISKLHIHIQQQYELNEICKALHQNNIISDVCFIISDIEFYPLNDLIKKNKYIKSLSVVSTGTIGIGIYKLVPYLINNKTMKFDISSYKYMFDNHIFENINNRNKLLKPINRLLHIIIKCNEKILCRLILYKIIEWL
jgi:hypothetical protein